MNKLLQKLLKPCVFVSLGLIAPLLPILKLLFIERGICGKDDSILEVLLR